MAGSQQERRKSIRLNVKCPCVVRDPSGATLGKGRCLNIGNRGMFLPLPVDALPTRDEVCRGRSTSCSSTWSGRGRRSATTGLIRPTTPLNG